MTEQEFQDYLAELVAIGEDYGTLPEIRNWRTFEEAAILTNNKGLVVYMADGSEFRITIVRSR